MITLRCTRRAAKALGYTALEDAPAGTSPLGDWYVNLVGTAAGGLFIFVNEQSLMVVAVPNGTPDILRVFVRRVANILSMIGVPNERIETELEHFRDARVGKTSSRRVLGVTNDIAFQCQDQIERALPAKISLSDLELELAKMPHATLGFSTAKKVALELLSSPARFGAA